MRELDEKVLEAWLDISTSINNDRLVPTLTYNEALVCHFVYLVKDEDITASVLCQKTGILKSQMNRILNELENKGLIQKIRSEVDKRDIFIVPGIKAKQFDEHHEKILTIVNKVTSRLSPTKSQEVIDLFQEVAKIAKEEL